MKDSKINKIIAYKLKPNKIAEQREENFKLKKLLKAWQE